MSHMVGAEPSVSEADDAPVLNLDGTGWRDVLDFCEALADLVGGPRPAACSVQAVTDSMIWNEPKLREPPYRIIVTSVSDPELRDFIGQCGRWTEESRQYFNQLNGADVRVSLGLGD